MRWTRMKPTTPGPVFAFVSGRVVCAELDEHLRVAWPFSGNLDMSGLIWCYGDRIALPDPPQYRQGVLWEGDES